jgi:hypothetical protein
MKRETIRMLKLGAADVTNGINAKIAAVSLDAGDVRPAAVNLYNDIDHKWVARRRVSAEETAAAITFPAFAIFQHGSVQVVDVEVETIVRDALIQVGFAHLVKENNPLEAISDGEYVNRAVLQFLNWVMRNDQASSFRTRNGIVIRSIDTLIQDDVHEDWDGAVCVAQTIATFRVRETQP